MKTMGNNTSCLSLGTPVKFGHNMWHCISGKYTTLLIKNNDITNQFNNNLALSCKFSSVEGILDLIFLLHVLSSL